jgi:hypothetical protein
VESLASSYEAEARQWVAIGSARLGCSSKGEQATYASSAISTAKGWLLEETTERLPDRL